MMNSGSNFGELRARAIKSAGKWTSWRDQEARNSNRFLLFPPIFGEYGDLFSDCVGRDASLLHIVATIDKRGNIPFGIL